MAKSRGVDQPEKKGQSEFSSSRLMNVGKVVKVTQVIDGDPIVHEFRVRELSLFGLTEILIDAADLFMSLGDIRSDSDGLIFLVNLLRRAETKETICKLFAEFCGATDPTVFEKMTATEGLQLIKAIKDVTDFEEIKKLFFDLGLEKLVPIASTASL
jgi:hypothetical protein